ncbi:MAG: GHKL domain-containing protein [Saprospiraceae bacterium]|nr:GHKL domain-containing protein [Saprospiraceae bacterium]
MCEARLDALRIQKVIYGDLTEKAFEQSDIYQSLIRDFERQRLMIMGEGAVFFVVLLIGMGFLNRGFRKEVSLARQQQNFLLSITHELKSPIASIKLALDTFMKRPNLKPEQIQLLSRGALTETERLHNLVNNILLAARIETSFEISLEPLNFNDLIQENLKQVRTKFSNVRFDFQSNDELPMILGDRFALNSIIVNLLENAVKYSPKGDEVAIRLNKNGTFLHFEIADKGIGISNEDKERVFEKFYRVGNEDTRKTKGTGLGLFIVKNMITAHKGTIQILDNQPKGSIFKVVLPIN